MLGNQPVRVVVASNEWVDVLDISSGNELASVALNAAVQLEDDLLYVGNLSILVDRSYLTDAQSLVNVASRIRPQPRPASESNRFLFCTQCGSSVGSSAKFCTSCGNALSPTAESEAAYEYRTAGPVEDSMRFQDPTFGDAIDRQPNQAITRHPMSETNRRNLVFLIAVIFVGVVFVIVTRGGGNDSQSEFSENINTSGACQTLSNYAFNGIPATYIDDGAQLLYSLSDEFSSLGRGDISNLINEVVDLTYQGPGGQLSAKNLLIDTASTYC